MRRSCRVHASRRVLRGKRRFHVEKGKRWSLVEHLMLDAVANQIPPPQIKLSQSAKVNYE